MTNSVDRREFLKIAAGTVGASAFASHAANRVSSRRPNIVFVITDDQERSEFNFLPEGRDANGKRRNLTPNIDMLAREGVVLDAMHVTSPVCTPSRYTCLTGRYASRATNPRFVHALNRNSQANITWNTHIMPDTPNLASLLKSAGYVTGGVGKNHVIETEQTKIPKGSSVKDPAVVKTLADNHAACIEAYKSCGFDFAASIYNGNMGGFPVVELDAHNMDWITKGALDFLDIVRDRGKPFFLYMATTLNHGPSDGNKRYTANPLATPAGLLDEPLDVMPSRASLEKRVEAAGLPLETTCDSLWLDDALGAVIDKLRQHGMLDDTIIFFFNDHGVESGKATLYQGGALTPCVVWAKKGFAGGRRVDRHLTNLDFVPTILDMCNVPQTGRPDLDGKSFLSLLEGNDRQVHDALFFEIGATRAVIKGDWKYIAFRVPDYMKNMSDEDREKSLQRHVTTDPYAPFTHLADRPGGRGSEQPAKKHYKNYYDEDQLYNLHADPEEQINLASDPQYKTKLDELKSELKLFLATVPGTFAEFTGE